MAAGAGLGALQGMCYVLPHILMIFRLKTTGSICAPSTFWPNFD